MCAGKPSGGLYEPVLADSEREAVADLLQYLENVCEPPTRPTEQTMTDETAARRDGLLLWRAITSSEYLGLFRQYRFTAKC